MVSFPIETSNPSFGSLARFLLSVVFSGNEVHGSFAHGVDKQEAGPGGTFKTNPFRKPWALLCHKRLPPMLGMGWWKEM